MGLTYWSRWHYWWTKGLLKVWYKCHHKRRCCKDPSKKWKRWRWHWSVSKYTISLIISSHISEVDFWNKFPRRKCWEKGKRHLLKDWSDHNWRNIFKKVYGESKLKKLNFIFGYLFCCKGPFTLYDKIYSGLFSYFIVTARVPYHSQYTQGKGAEQKMFVWLIFLFFSKSSYFLTGICYFQMVFQQNAKGPNTSFEYTGQMGCPGWTLQSWPI